MLNWRGLAAVLALGACTSDEPPKASAETQRSVHREIVWSPAPPDGDVPPSATASAKPASPVAAVDAGAVEPDAGELAAAPKPAATADAPKDEPPKRKDPAAPEAAQTAPKPTSSPAETPAPEPAEAAVKLPPAAPGTADAVAEAIDAIYVPKKTFFAKFKQEHMQKISGVVKRSTGTIYVEKPNKLSFRYDPPNKNRIVSDGNRIKIYVAEDQQMIEQPVGNSQYPGALAFLMGNGIRPSFTFTFHDKANFPGGHVLVGKPRVATPHYESVLFYVDKNMLAARDANAVRRVLIIDAQANRNRFDFEGASQPAKIDSGEWVFTPPAGTNIVTNK